MCTKTTPLFFSLFLFFYYSLDKHITLISYTHNHSIPFIQHVQLLSPPATAEWLANVESAAYVASTACCLWQLQHVSITSMHHVSLLSLPAKHGFNEIKPHLNGFLHRKRVSSHASHRYQSYY